MPAFFLPRISHRKEDAQPKPCCGQQSFQDAQSQQGDEGVPGAEMKERSGSTLGCSNLEIRAGRDRIWHFGLARAGREQQGGVTWGLVG